MSESADRSVSPDTHLTNASSNEAMQGAFRPLRCRSSFLIRDLYDDKLDVLTTAP
jgi:hypothetical protein